MTEDDFASFIGTAGGRLLEKSKTAQLGGVKNPTLPEVLNLRED
jgi:hypothetical protein